MLSAIRRCAGPRLALSAVLAGAVVAGLPSSAGGQQPPADFASRLATGEAALTNRQFDAALKAFKEASDMRGRKSPEAHLGIARAHQGAGRHKDAVHSCDDALKHVAGQSDVEVAVRNVRGVSLAALSQRPDDKWMKDAEREFRAVVALDPSAPPAHYSLGIVLLKQSRDDEGVQELRKYLEIAENGPHAASARTYIAEPERARLLYAPPFSVTTLTGDTVRLDEYHGKVVLLDFWATWCPPCVSATPGLVALHRKFAERPFVMIGISADHGEKPLRSYIEKNSLTWPQHLDDNTLAAMYGVTGFPTYVLIDHEGAVRARKAGWSQDIDQWLEREIDKLLKAIPNGSD